MDAVKLITLGLILGVLLMISKQLSQIANVRPVVKVYMVDEHGKITTP